MKKIATMGILLALLMFSLTACASKTTHAYAEITTSGTAAIVEASKTIEDALENGFKVNTQDGATVAVHFFCSECGHDETVELTIPAARVFSCDCDETNDNNVKGYFAIVAAIGEEEESTK